MLLIWNSVIIRLKEVVKLPWKVVKGHSSCNGGFAVVKKDSGAVVACHSSEDEAKDHVKALYANVPDARKSTEPAQLGYWVDLSSLSFDDESTWVHAMPLGKYEHPVYGTIDINTDKVQRYAQGVKNKVRGQDLDIDYDHKDKTGEAAGWVKDAESCNDGLHLLVNWTKDAHQKVKDKAYRYFSPEFQDEWVHPQTGKRHQDVLFGGALTNRPFLKGILPINASEVSGVVPPKEGEDDVDLVELRKALGLNEDSSDEVVVTLATTKLKEQPKPPEQPDIRSVLGLSEAASDDDVITSVVHRMKPSYDPSLKNLAEDNPAVKTLMESIEAQGKELKAQRDAYKVSETRRVLGELYSVPPAVKQLAEEVITNAPEAVGDKVYEMLKHMSRTGPVEFGERGAMLRKTVEKSATQQFNEATVAAMQNQSMSYADAVEHVSAAKPGLYEQYRQEMFSSEGVNE